VPSIFLSDGPITPGPRGKFCDLLQDQLVERLDQLRQEPVATHQITMSGLPPKDEVDEALDRLYRLHRVNCEQVRTRADWAWGFVAPDDIADPRNALLQFMVAATPNDAVVAGILRNRDQIRGKMTSWLGCATLVEMIDRVPGAVSPVKSKPVYLQLPDGDKTTLVQAWRVSALDSISRTTL